MNLPKRRKIKDNPYTLEVDHLLTFIDSRGNKQSIKISDELYKEFNQFELDTIKEMNEYDRHLVSYEYCDEILYHKVKGQQKLLEDIVLEKIVYEKLYQEIEKLPEIQKRRLKLYYFEEMTLEEIAQIENCTKMAIKFSINAGLKRILKNLKF